MHGRDFHTTANFCLCNHELLSTRKHELIQFKPPARAGPWMQTVTMSATASCAYTVSRMCGLIFTSYQWYRHARNDSHDATRHSSGLITSVSASAAAKAACTHSRNPPCISKHSSQQIACRRESSHILGSILAWQV